MKRYAAPFEKYVNLADARLGTRALSVTDDWFADVNRLFQPTPAVWNEGVFDDNGKWMDGWETRRRRTTGHATAIIKLALAGTLQGVDFDTSFFTGNFPPSASLEACFLAEGDPDDSTAWTEVLPAVELKGDSHHYHEIAFDKPVSHLRFNIYPDGGVARRLPDYELRPQQLEMAELVERAIQQANGNKTEAARLLGLSRPRLYRRLVQLGFTASQEHQET